MGYSILLGKLLTRNRAQWRYTDNRRLRRHNAHPMLTVPQLSVPTIAISGSEQRFPVHRIYCVGRNYAEHAREMGHDPRRELPFFFGKPADAVVGGGRVLPYPPRTADLHHEVELVVALHQRGVDGQ